MDAIIPGVMCANDRLPFFRVRLLAEARAIARFVTLQPLRRGRERARAAASGD